MSLKLPDFVSVTKPRVLKEFLSACDVFFVNVNASSVLNICGGDIVTWLAPNVNIIFTERGLSDARFPDESMICYEYTRTGQ